MRVKMDPRMMAMLQGMGGGGGPEMPQNDTGE